MAKQNRRIAVDLNRSAVARYLQLSTLFRRRIEYGEWPVGEQIPTVEALTAEYGVAPATIRKAVDLLVKDGLIARYRAKGSYVLRSGVQSLWSEIETDSRGFLKARAGATMKVLVNRQVKAPPLPVTAGTLTDGYRHLRRLYLRDDQPFMMMDLYVDAELSGSWSRRDVASKTGRELVRSVPSRFPVSLRQILTISTADVEAAGHLDLPLNAPVVRIDRTRVDRDGRAIMISSGIYRADVVRLDFREEEQD